MARGLVASDKATPGREGEKLPGLRQREPRPRREAALFSYLSGVRRNDYILSMRIRGLLEREREKLFFSPLVFFRFPFHPLGPFSAQLMNEQTIIIGKI